MNTLINIAYIIASVCFIVGIKMLSSPATARKGNMLSGIGMFVAVIITLLNKQIISYEWIIVGIIVGGLIGGFAARLVAMTAMPEMVALFNGFGGAASLLVGAAVYHVSGAANTPWGILFSIYLAVIIGGLTFTGSIVAYLKLSEKISGKPTLFAGQHLLNALLVVITLIGLVLYSGNFFSCLTGTIFVIAIILSLIMGVLVTIPIGGADMPVVIALLNSYSGLAACASGFAIMNNVLIVSGALVGASGIILTKIMCKAMNRSLGNVLFGGFGATKKAVGSDEFQGEVKPITADDTYYILEAASSVLVIPGYGMAVAQAQHAVKELGELLQANGAEVQYVVHPVAGRMPGHMNVLLAEAGVPYEQLVEPEDVNPNIENVDVCLVIGANDVVNPAARDDESSDLYGMPIIEVDRARTVIVFKRSMGVGFAGVQNRLFFNDNTRMLFGDAKASVTGIVSAFKE